VPLGHPAGDEEGLAKAVPLEQFQDQRHRHLRAVRALREHAGSVGVGRIVADPDLLRIEVEREGDRSLGTVRPDRHGPAYRPGPPLEHRAFSQ
jgi:hypothetical protein